MNSWITSVEGTGAPLDPTVFSLAMFWWMLLASTPSKVKLFATEVAGRVIDKCLQLHGGYGYILEYPIARLYADTRVSRIYGGTSEVMKTIIAKSLGV